MNIRKIFGWLALGAVVCGCMSGSFSSEFVAMCTFEYSDQQQVFGKDSIYCASEFAEGQSSLIFHNKTDNGTFSGGFLISLLRDTTFEPGYVKSYYSVADTSKNTRKGNGFVVYYDNARKSQMPEHSMTFQYYANGSCTLTSMYVCNTNHVANAALYGVPGCPAFKEGDYMKLKITGILDGKSTGSVETDLVTFGDKGLELVRGWKRVELNRIGSFQYLDLSIETNRDDAPRYCCIDNIMANISISD